MSLTQARAFAIIALLAIAGCGTSSTEGGKTNASTNPALLSEARTSDARKAELDALLANTPKETTPIRGKAKIVVPTPDLKKEQTKTSEIAKIEGLKHLRAHLSELSWKTSRAAADSIVASGLFDNAAVVEQDDTQNPDIGDADYLIWEYVRFIPNSNAIPFVQTWKIRKKDSAVSVDIPPPPGYEYTPGIVAVDHQAHTINVGQPDLTEHSFHTFLAGVRSGAVRLAGTGTGNSARSQ